MTDYTKLVEALTCCNDGKLPCHNNECPYWVDQWHGIGLCNVIKKDADAADAIEALQAVIKEADKKQAYQHDCICELTAENEELKADVDQWKAAVKGQEDGIKVLQAEIRKSMQKCAECGDEQEQKVKELQARLGEAENSAERWKDMYLTKHEPKRGKWILKERAHYFKCSICKEPIPYKFGYGGNRYYNFCPRCGADMRAKMEVQE